MLTECRLLRLDPFATILWFFITILLVYAHGSHCRTAAQDISATTYTILIILYLQFIISTVVPVSTPRAPKTHPRH